MLMQGKCAFNPDKIELMLDSGIDTIELRLTDLDVPDDIETYYRRRRNLRTYVVHVPKVRQHGLWSHLKLHDICNIALQDRVERVFKIADTLGRIQQFNVGVIIHEDLCLNDFIDFNNMLCAVTKRLSELHRQYPYTCLLLENSSPLEEEYRNVSRNFWVTETCKFANTLSSMSNMSVQMALNVSNMRAAQYMADHLSGLRTGERMPDHYVYMSDAVKLLNNIKVVEFSGLQLNGGYCVNHCPPEDGDYSYLKMLKRHGVVSDQTTLVTMNVGEDDDAYMQLAAFEGYRRYCHDV